MTIKTTLPGFSVPRLSVSSLSVVALVFLGSLSGCNAPVSLSMVPPAEPSPEGMWLAANQALDFGDFKRASDFFTRVPQKDQMTTGFLGRHLLAAAAAGDAERTGDLAQLLIARDPAQSLASLVLMVDDVLDDNWPSVLARLRSVPVRGVDAITVPLYRAWAWQALGQQDQAWGSLDALRDGGDVLKKQQQALIADLGGDSDLAARLSDELLATGQLTGRQYHVIANFYARHGQRAKALTILERLERVGGGSDLLAQELADLRRGRVPVPLIPDARAAFGEILSSTAVLLSNEKIPDLALVYFQQALRLQTGTARDSTLLLIAGLYRDLRQGEAALNAWTAIPAHSPHAWAAALQMAGALYDSGRRDDALTLLDDLAQQRPNRFEPLLRKGNILRLEKRFSAAATTYSRALTRVEKPERRHWRLLYYRGISYERVKDWDRAEKDFLQALELSPDQPVVLNYLAYSWLEQMRHLQQAEEMLLKAVELRPHDGFIVDSLGWAYYRLGQFDQAVIYLEQAVELHPEEATINDHLGDAYWRTDRRHEARFQWRRALGFGPEDGQKPVIEQKLRDGLPPPSDAPPSDAPVSR